MSLQTPVPRLGEAPTNVSRSSLGELERAKCKTIAPVYPEIAPGGAYRAHVRDAVFDVTARSDAAGDAADCGGEVLVSMTLPVSLKRQNYPSPDLARSRPVASPTKTATEDSSRPLRTRRQPCGGWTPWHLAGLGSFRVGYQPVLFTQCNAA
jgi:hypothetical protein